MMAPWDSKIRWQFGGNLQRVRLICELNWRECPLAIANHIWSEIVTDVVDCVTNEGILLRLIILILVCTILFHTIWTRTQWITGSIVSKDSLNRVDFRVQDLELRVNVLTYKMQYGAWPSPQQINDTNIKELKDDMRLSLSGSSSHRYSWWDRGLDSGNIKDRYISRSENLGLRLRKPETLIETSKKIYYNHPREMRELQLFEDALDIHKRSEKRQKMEKVQKKYIEAIKNNEKCHMTKGVRDSSKGSRMPKSIMKKRGEKRRKSMSENSLRKSKRAYLSLKSIHDYIPATTTAESSCDDSGNQLSTLPNINSKLKMNSSPFAIKTLPAMDSSASFKRINSTQETLANVKERLENLHTVLKIYESRHDLESTREDAAKEELAKAFLQHSGELCTETEKIDEKSSGDFASERTETKSAHDKKPNIESVCNENDTHEQIDETKDGGSDSEVKKIDDEMKSPTLIDTDEDLGSFSSPPDPSKVGSDSDKSTQSSDALMLNALLNQLDLTNLRRWNDKTTLGTADDESECETENIFPKMKSFYQSKLLDIISEEQSGSSCTERASKTVVHSKILSKKNDSMSEFSNELQNEGLSNSTGSCESTEQNIIEKNTPIELKHPDLNIKNNDGNPEMNEETKDNMKDFAFNCDKNASELSNILPQIESGTVLNTVRSIRPWEKLLEYSSEESIGHCAPDSENYHWNTGDENISNPDDSIEIDYLFDIQNGEQLIDITNLSLKRRPGVFSMPKSTNIPERENQLTQNPDNDLIDLNYDDSDNVLRNEGMNPSHEADVPISLMDVTAILNTADIDCLSETIPLTDRTVITTNKIEDNIDSHATNNDEVGVNHQNNDICPVSLCKNSSRNLIELERITYAELTQVENSWDSEWKSNNSYEEISISDAEIRKEEDKKLRSHSKKSSLNILSSPSSVYLTVEGSFSDMSMDSNQCMESIEKIEMPDEVKNIGNVEETHAYCDYSNKPGHEIIITSKKGKDNEDEEGTVISKDSALSETPQQSIIVEDNTDTNGKYTNADISSMNSSAGTSSYVDADSHNLTHSSGVSSSFDPSEFSQSVDGKTVHLSSLANEAVTTINVDPVKTAKRKFVTKKVDSRKLKPTKSNGKKQSLSGKAKSNSNLTGETSLNLQTQKSDNRTEEFGQRRTKSYIIPRKRDATQVHQDSSQVRQHNSSTKFDNAETRRMNSKINLMDRLSNTKMRIDGANSFSKSRESVNKSTSKSCIPVLKTRLDGTKNLDSRSRNLLRGPLTTSVDIGRNSMEMKRNERTVCVDKNDKSDDKTKVYHETIDNVNDKHSMVVPERQTVIYVNIVTDHDNCVTKVVNPKKFLEHVKDKDLNIQEIVNDNCSHNENKNDSKECTNSKFVTVISSTEKNPLSFYEQREIEVLAKPSVIDTSTSISDIPKDNNQPIELTTDEYMALLKTLEQPTNFYEYQKIHQACSELESDAQE